MLWCGNVHRPYVKLVESSNFSCIQEIMYRENGDGNGDKNSGAGDTAYGAGIETKCAGIGAQTTGTVGMKTRSCPYAAL